MGSKQARHTATKSVLVHPKCRLVFCVRDWVLLYMNENAKRSAESFLILYTAISRKVVRQNVHATIPKGNMGYDQYTVPDTVAVEPSFVVFL